MGAAVVHVAGEEGHTNEQYEHSGAQKMRRSHATIHRWHARIHRCLAPLQEAYCYLPNAKKMQARPLKNLIHFTAWSVMLLVPLLSSPPPEARPMAFTPRSEPIFHLLFVTILAVAFYFNRWVLVPRMLLHGQRAAYVGAAAAVVALLSLVFHQAVVTWYQQGGDDQVPQQVRSVPIIMLSLIILLSTSLRLAEEWTRSKQRVEVMAKERSEQELQALRGRIDPHYLFNALNSIYALAVARDARTPDAILKLSGLMRYVFDRGTSDLVPLEEEIDHIRAYVDMQSLRSNEQVTVDMNVKGVMNGARIPPLLMQPFVENAFKHGVSANSPSPIDIAIDLRGAQLVMHVTNRIQRHSSSGRPVGTGLSDIRRRLELIYPGTHQLLIREDEDIHRVLLTIDLA